jgi:asparagine N-glycosylation enzyme membrane subunit Stt3
MMVMDTDRFNDARDETLIRRRPWYVLAAALLILSAITHQPIAFLAAVFALVIGLVPELWYRFALRRIVQ